VDKFILFPDKTLCLGRTYSNSVTKIWKTYRFIKDQNRALVGY
jgi:hypothetical protein